MNFFFFFDNKLKKSLAFKYYEMEPDSFQVLLLNDQIYLCLYLG